MVISLSTFPLLFVSIFLNDFVNFIKFCISFVSPLEMSTHIVVRCSMVAIVGLATLTAGEVRNLYSKNNGSVILLVLVDLE